MKKILQKAGILFLIFIGALVVYFISARNTMEKESAVYTSMEEPSLPVVYTQLGGQEINCLHGYMQDMGNQAARESISVLPEDRGLHIRIEEYGNTITGISYEVRNLTLDRLVERTEVEDWENGDGSVSAVLPIQTCWPEMRHISYHLPCPRERRNCIIIPESCGRTIPMRQIWSGWPRSLPGRVWTIIRQEIWYPIWKPMTQRITVHWGMLPSGPASAI